MPIRSKTVRLSKAAKEFNVGISTIVEYLSSKGYEIESKPNTKIEADAYEVLVEEFQDSKQLKEKSKLAGVSPGKRETVSIKKEEPEEPKKEEPKEEKKEQDSTIKPSVEKKPGISVVGKIDLDKKKAEKEAPKEEKKEEKAEEKAPAKEEVEEKKKEASEEKKEAEKQAPAEKKEEKPKKEEIETIRTNVTKLDAPTVVGKIELPKETPKKKKKKPVMSTDPETETQQGRRKRKRINSKVDVKQQGQKGRKKQRRSNERQEVSQEDIDRELKETLAKLSGGSKSKAAKNRRMKRDEHSRKAEERQQQEEQDSKILKLTEYVTVSDLANLMDVGPTDVISACMTLGIMVSINQRLDAETITIVAEEFGYEVEFTSAEVQESIQVEEDKP
jgi:translation initiation factor IF-2